MSDIAAVVTGLGGIAHRRAISATDRDLTSAVRSGGVLRLRRGWYATLSPLDPRCRARAIGGRLTGASAARLLGAWMWRSPPLEVSVRQGASRLGRHAPPTRIHYDPPDVHKRGSPGTVDVRDALVHAIASLAFEESVSVLDWALYTRRIDDVDLYRIGDRLPRSLAPIVAWTDKACESFLESVVRTRLRIAGHTVMTQQPVGRSQRIDLVVDGVLAIEVDGREYHESTFESDRRKDLDITLEGRHCLRITYTMVLLDWDAVLAAVRSALSARRRATLVPSLARQARPRDGSRPRGWSLETPRRRTGGGSGGAVATAGGNKGGMQAPDAGLPPP